ncbi:MAG TPA: hypothetical protein VD694_08205, partial [Nitrososphaeraceae archaeon]|nr:hypothetical protein [Nitrososphaeraceae archaeon]
PGQFIKAEENIRQSMQRFVDIQRKSESKIWSYQMDLKNDNQSVSRTPALEVYIVIHPLTPKDIPEDKDLIDDKAT